MRFLERVAWHLLRRRGYTFKVLSDHWNLVLAEKERGDWHSHHRSIHKSLLFDRLNTLLTEAAVDLVIDVGAHVGRFGTDLRRIGYMGTILSCEPNPRAYDSLTQASHDDPDWFTRRVAIAATAGRKTLHVTEDSSFSSFLRPNDYSTSVFGELSRVVSYMEVDAFSLDAVIREFCTTTGSEPRSVFVKSDTQGFEQEVIDSLGEAHSMVRGLLVEVPVKPIYRGAALPELGASHSAYEARGYSLAFCAPVSWDADGAIIELDCIYIRCDQPQDVVVGNGT